MEYISMKAMRLTKEEVLKQLSDSSSDILFEYNTYRLPEACLCTLIAYWMSVLLASLRMSQISRFLSQPDAWNAVSESASLLPILEMLVSSDISLFWNMSFENVMLEIQQTQIF